jgi:hypothetical protein
LKDLRTAFLPLMAQSLRYLPLPMIVIDSPDFYMTLDNVVFRLDNVLPNLVEFTVSNSVQMSPRMDFPDAYFMNLLELNILQIQTDLRNVEFRYVKKGFPRMEDEGVMDIFIGGNGLSLHTKTAFDPNLWYTTVVPVDIKADIDVMKVKLHETNRDLLYRLMGKVLVTRLKREICKNLEESIYNYLVKLDGFLTNVGSKIGKEVLMGGKRGMNLW